MWKVLIADDEPFVREALKEMIPWNELGFQLEGAYRNGKELVDDIDEKSPDLVVLDIQMPVMNGLEAARIIHEKHPEIIVVVLTAFADFEYARQAIVSQVRRYVIKSNLLEDLPEALGEIAEEIRKETEKKKIETLRTLLEEAEYMDIGLDNSPMIEWYKDNFQDFQVIVFQGYMGDREKREAFRNRIVSYIEHVISGHGEYVVDMKTTECVVLLSDFPETEIGSLIGEENHNLIAGMSQKYCGIENISISYKAVLKQIGKHFFDKEEGDGAVSCAGQWSIRNNKELPKFISQVMKIIEERDEEKFIDEMQNIREYLPNYSDAQIKSMGLFFLSECHRICVECGWEFTDVFGKDQEMLMEYILDTNVFSDIEQCITQMILSVIRKKNNEVQTGDELILSINSFIDNNYHKKITLDLIANMVHANPSYISRIYKQKTGDKLFDTINRRKVELAKTYIEDGRKHVYEIANLVGIDDSAYFSKVFKKYTGYSPKEYEMICRK